MLILTRRETFTSAHRLVSPTWTDEKNWQVFGKDANLHGHTYTLEVSVTGEVDPETGMIVDLRNLRDTIKQVATDKLDHADLNSSVDFLQGIMPSAENIVVACWQQLAPALAPVRLHRLRLWESENNSVEYDGPD